MSEKSWEYKDVVDSDDPDTTVRRKVKKVKAPVVKAVPEPATEKKGPKMAAGA